jgi:SAM-dependent methyltransferase
MISATSAAVKRSPAYIALRKWQKAVGRRLQLHQYRGTQYRCPICRVSLRAFKPVWKSFWMHYQQYEYKYSPFEWETFNFGAFSCPSCGSTDRERLPALYLDRVLSAYDSTRRYRLVEFAPGQALERTIRRYPFIEYRRADLYRNDVDDRVDLTNCPYADGSVDVFICSHVLEHIPDDRKAMRELNRIITADGFGIVLVPLFPHIDETHEDASLVTVEQRWKHFGGGDHLRQYGKRDFVDRLGAAGFRIDQLGVDYFGREVFRKSGIAENSVLYVVRKARE